MHNTHDARNHPGTNITHQIVAQRYWWPNVAKDVTDYVKSCDACQRAMAPNHAAHGTWQPVEVPEQPNEIWSLDTVIIGTAANGSKDKNAQCDVDHHSRMCWTFPTKTNTAEIVISCLSGLFAAVGKPKVLIMDNGTNFRSKKTINFLQSHGVETRFTSTYHPQANGLNERTHYTVIRGISLRLAEAHTKKKWAALARESTAMYNETPHGVTGFSPVLLHFGQRPTHAPFNEITIEEARKLAVERTRHAQEQRRLRFEKSHKPVAFEIGDEVLHLLTKTHPDRNKLTPMFEGPYLIAEKHGTDSYRITREDGELRADLRVHVSSLRKYHRRPQRLVIAVNSLIRNEITTKSPKSAKSTDETTTDGDTHRSVYIRSASRHAHAALSSSSWPDTRSHVPTLPKWKRIFRSSGNVESKSGQKSSLTSDCITHRFRCRMKLAAMCYDPSLGSSCTTSCRNQSESKSAVTSYDCSSHRKTTPAVTSQSRRMRRIRNLSLPGCRLSR